MADTVEKLTKDVEDINIKHNKRKRESSVEEARLRSGRKPSLASQFM